MSEVKLRRRPPPERRNCDRPIGTKGSQLLARRSEESCFAHLKTQSTHVDHEGQFPTALQSLHGASVLESKVAALVLSGKKEHLVQFPLAGTFHKPMSLHKQCRVGTTGQMHSSKSQSTFGRFCHCLGSYSSIDPSMS